MNSVWFKEAITLTKKNNFFQDYAGKMTLIAFHETLVKIIGLSHLSCFYEHSSWPKCGNNE